MEIEKWVPILGWEGLYEVSDMGRVRSLIRYRYTTFGLRPYGGFIVTLIKKSTGYLYVNLTGNGRRVQEAVHRLVLSSFMGPPCSGNEACHGDGDRANNILSNLRWDTRKSNHADKIKHGTWQGGEANGNSKLTVAAVLDIRSSRESYKRLADKYGVSCTSIYRVKKRELWGHV